MEKYINVETFKKKLIDEKSFFPAIVARALEEMPTADVVEVIRCKDCEYYENGKDYAPYCNNVMNLFEEMKPTDYCSYGERREDNGGCNDISEDL